MLYVCRFGDYIGIGGEYKEIIGKYYSAWNFGAINGELLSMSDNFFYFLTKEEAYVKARAINMSFHWPWNYKKGKRDLALEFAKIKARKELNSFKQEKFLNHCELSEIQNLD